MYWAYQLHQIRDLHQLVALPIDLKPELKGLGAPKLADDAGTLIVKVDIAKKTHA